jgi:hypothetical protein
MKMRKKMTKESIIWWIYNYRNNETLCVCQNIADLIPELILLSQNTNSKYQKVAQDLVIYYNSLDYE